MPQYDKIAEQYDQSAEERSDREMVLTPSAKHYLGDVAGKRVLDLACGSGYFTRLLKAWGAEKVVGIDISKEMIELARQREKQEEQGIEYAVGDVLQLGKLEEFDIVFAGFLLHYSSSVEQLTMMCKNISQNLGSGGKFVSFNENPRFPIHTGIKYGVETTAFGDVRDGTKIRRTHYVQGKKDFSIEHYHFEPGTYEQALQSAGFVQIEWKQFVGSENADDYWRDYLGDFSIAVLLACKR